MSFDFYFFSNFGSACLLAVNVSGFCLFDFKSMYKYLGFFKC